MSKGEGHLKDTGVVPCNCAFVFDPVPGVAWYEKEKTDTGPREAIPFLAI